MTVASRVLDACAGELPLHAGAIYAPSLGSPGLARLATVGEIAALPREIEDASVSELDPTVTVQPHPNGIRLVMIGESDIVALAELVPAEHEVPADAIEGLEIVAALGTAAFTAARKVDAIARTGIKDPDTSAYTFAYFGDVAGREIDRAARHGRRFGLLTVSLDGMDILKSKLMQDELVQLRRSVTDAVLSSVRDSDVLARVEDDEYYLLLPETGMLGAAAARRRIMRKFESSSELRQYDGAIDPIVGIAVYPGDGADLGRLLRVSRRRSERSRRGPYRRLGLGNRSFWECIEVFLGEDDQVASFEDEISLGAHATMSRTLISRIASQVATDAVRSKASGTLYVAGDDEAAAAVASALSVADSGPVRAWILGASG
ncbi:MAG: diguanylate cyclase, partial [Polyangiaceae bacterium]|nr:diguanylate cyclase [Polyangiaceae bacterium]